MELSNFFRQLDIHEGVDARWEYTAPDGSNGVIAEVLFSRGGHFDPPTVSGYVHEWSSEGYSADYDIQFEVNLETGEILDGMVGTRYVNDIPTIAHRMGQAVTGLTRTY